MKADAADPFHPDNLRIPPEMLAEMLAKDGETPIAKNPKKQRRKSKEIQYFSFPASVLQAVRCAEDSRKPSGAAFSIMLAVYELRYQDHNHAQTVKLTKHALERYGVSRGQKRRALQILERSGQYAVEYREEFQNPWIIELWRPFWK